MSIRVRFAPSPTGQVHIGNIRTAIFNWLFARHSNGAFILRIEDTDLERSTDDAKQKLFECLEWLGLDYDETVMYQSQRRAIYLAAVDKMLAAGSAYRALAEVGTAAPILFRLPLETADNPVIRDLEIVKETIHTDIPVEISSAGITFAQVSRKGKPMPVAASLAGFRQLKIFDNAGVVLFDLEAKLDAVLNGEIFTITGGVELEFLRKEVFFTDMIKGEMAKPLDGMKDLVIVRSDGSPIFHIANVCDDNAQQITHVVRGDDHVENTYRHILLFNALGYNIPKYAHMPMIVNQAGKPYSKRDGDAFVGDFRDNGILADALLNYLSLLGWSPGDDREKMTRSELIEAFNLERVKSAPAQLDMKKLINMNGAYIAEMPLKSFIAATWCEFLKSPFVDKTKQELFADVAELMQPRTKQFNQVLDWNYFFTDDFEYNAKAFKKSFKREENRVALTAVAEAFSALELFNSETVPNAIAQIENKQGLHEGQLNLPLRLAVTGTNAGGDIIKTLLLIGQERSIARIKSAIADFNSIN
jgi:glutamyl/glutaminyl-tRNA synthetase